MSVLKVADFHYGAFLSALLNYGKRSRLCLTSQKVTIPEESIV